MSSIESSKGGFAAYLVEPIQGEAGVSIPQTGYLKVAKDQIDRALEIISSVLKAYRMLIESA